MLIKINSLKQWWILSLVGIISLLSRWAYYQKTKLTFDDALITLRYVKNIVLGYGFVYNLGERVLGVSTPLYTLFLSIFSSLIPLDLITAAHGLNALLAGLSAVLFFLVIRQIFKNFEFSIVISLVGTIVYILAAPLIRLEMSGMESGLVVCLLLLLFYLFLKRRLRWFWIVSAGVVLTRPDLVIYPFTLGILQLILSYRRKELAQFIQATVFFWVLIFAWELFSFFYFSSWLPNSILAKKTVYNNQAWIIKKNLIFVWQYLFGPTVKSFLARAPFFLTFVAAIAGLLKQKKFEYLFFIGLGFLHLGILIARNLPLASFHWYLTPFLLSFYLSVGLGYAYLISFFTAIPKRLMQFRLAKIAPKMATAVSVLLILASSWKPISYGLLTDQVGQKGAEESFKQIGLWLKDNTPVKARIFLEPIGYIGYYSKRYIIDKIGLVFPAMFPLINSPGWSCAAVQYFSPDYLVQRISEIKTFEKWSLDSQGHFSATCGLVEFDEVFGVGELRVLKKVTLL